MAWTYLLLASALEIGWAVGLKYTQGFTRPSPSILVAIGILGSFVLLARAAQTLPIGTAYGVFVGVGAAGTGLIGMLLLGEPTGAMRGVSLIAIVGGVVGLKLFGAPRDQPATAG
jgi:quaternary ammonium compound-resistance protein SugE